jgi:hypothetical protein
LARRPKTVDKEITDGVRMEAMATACIWACLYALIAAVVYGALYMIGMVSVRRGVILVSATTFLVSFLFAFAINVRPDMLRYRQDVCKALAEGHPVSPY